MSIDAPTRYGVPQQHDWNAMSDDAFRARVREQVQSTYPGSLRYAPHRLRWSVLAPWYRHMASIGWIAPSWPTHCGGMGLSPSKLLIFLEEHERWGVARYQDHGVLLIGPLLMRFGTEAQRRRFLPGILSCDAIWCQGYSEPGAGSDLASLRTRAVRDGDAWVIDGQKTWTTLAHDATHIFVLARTDPQARKQDGITFFLVDIATPGIRVRPIRDIAGHEEFCEVFFDGVRVPADSVLGDVNGGWSIAKSLLGYERVALGSPKLCEYGLKMLEHVARLAGLEDDPSFRDAFATLHLDVIHLADAYAAFADLLVRGEPIGPDVSLLKVWSTETFQRIADLIVQCAGACAALRGDTELGGEVADVVGAWYKARPATIYGGSNEIQRNIIARQVLGLPG